MADKHSVENRNITKTRKMSNERNPDRITWEDFEKEPFTNMDFEHRCCFPEQVRNIYRPIGHNGLVEVDMKSGRTAIFKLLNQHVGKWQSDPPDQRNWRFLFVKYKDGKKQ